jgi:hypothetical protein
MQGYAKQRSYIFVYTYTRSSARPCDVLCRVNRRGDEI